MLFTFKTVIFLLKGLKLDHAHGNFKGNLNMAKV